MKYIVLAMLLVVMQTPPPVPRKAANNPTSASQQVKQESHDAKHPSIASTTQNTPDINKHERKNQVEPSRDNNHSITISELPTVSVRKDLWDKLYICLTAALVAIGAITLAAIWYQAYQTKVAANATAESSKAMRDSVKLQEAQLVQWLELGEWKTELTNKFPDKSIGTLEVAFEIINPTSHPLTINNIKIIALEETVEFMSGNVLAPKKSDLVVFWVKVTPSQAQEYVTNGLTISIRGHIAYSGILKTKCSQFVHGICKCSPALTEFWTLTTAPLAPWLENQRDNDEKTN